MIVGIPKEIKEDEKRVSLLPHLIKPIIALGHKVIIQSNAGKASGFSNDIYKNEGAEVLPKLSDIYSKADLIIKVKEPLEEEIPMIKKSQMMFTFFHFPFSESE